MTTATQTSTEFVRRLAEHVIGQGHGLLIQDRGWGHFDFILLNEDFAEAGFLGRYDNPELVQRAIGWAEVMCGSAERFDAQTGAAQMALREVICPAEYRSDFGWHQDHLRLYNLAHSA